MRKFLVLYLAAVCVNICFAASYQLFDFEPPLYTAGTSVCEPWIISSSVSATITNNAIYGSQALAVIGGYSGGARYPISAAESDTFHFSVTLRLPSYNPGSYDGGYVSLGGTAMSSAEDWYIGGVYFELQKPYGAGLQPSHRQIWFKSAYNVVGYFVDGGTYTITYDINWVTKTSVVKIVGDGNIDITITNQDNMINKNSFSGFILRSAYSGAGAAIYDNMIIGQPPLFLTCDFNTDGIVDIKDYAVIAYSWHSVPDNDNWNPLCNLSNIDESENYIDIADLCIFADNWLLPM